MIGLRMMHPGCCRTADSHFLLVRRNGAWQLVALTDSASIALREADLAGKPFNTRRQAHAIADAIAPAA